MKPQVLFVTLLLVFVNVAYLSGAKSGERVLLEDVKAITLQHGKMTNGRRSSPVPQLKCVGGTAGCSAFMPQTVQCQNKGSDGYDVQWECKTDMDNSYRFGKLQVSCEGYDDPDDPYILRGSCGLEYTLDLTEEGYEKQKAGGHQYYGGHQHSDDYHDRSHYPQSYTKKASSIFQDLFYLCIIAGIIYVIYKTCIATPTVAGDAPPPYDAHDPHGNRQQPSSPPPPYGFRQDYMPGGDSCSGGASYTGGQTGNQTNTPPGTGGGFWSGAFTGGLMGYLFGSRNSGYTGYQRPHTGWWGGRNNWGNNWGTGWGSGWGNNWGTGGGWGSRTYTTTSSHRGSGFSSAPRSSGTRTASGFASTSRR